MAGILPTSVFNGKRYYLIGRESLKIKFKESGLYSDFGGGIEKNETKLNAAIREGFEETIGIIGDKKVIRNLIRNKLYKKVNINNEVIYVVKIKYDKNLPNKFKHKYKTLYSFLKKSPKNIQKKFKSYLEKDKVMWLTKEEMIKNKKNLRKHFIDFLNKI